MQIFSITHSSEVAQARRAASAFATQSGFGVEDSGRVALVATEICTNIVKHAQSGQLFFRALEEGEGGGIEMLGLDKGPGMSDVDKCMRDGYSTASSPGTGLGAIKRVSQRFDVYSRPDKGTVVMARLWPAASVHHPGNLDIGAIVIPKSGEQVCGDAWCYAQLEHGLLLVGVDGLGHGHHAAIAASEACRVFGEAQHQSPSHVLRLMHERLRSTRGAAATVVRIDWAAGQALIASIGNVVAVLAQGDTMKRMMSDNGIVGHVASKFRELSYPCTTDSILILHSDGLSASWQLERYPGLSQHDAGIIAGVLYRDFTRGRDDSMIVVVKRAAA